jgi:hypothetical protein
MSHGIGMRLYASKLVNGLLPTQFVFTVLIADPICHHFHFILGNIPVLLANSELLNLKTCSGELWQILATK